jgi:hypothetical protein
VVSAGGAFFSKRHHCFLLDRAHHRSFRQALRVHVGVKAKNHFGRWSFWHCASASVPASGGLPEPMRVANRAVIAMVPKEQRA